MTVKYERLAACRETDNMSAPLWLGECVHEWLCHCVSDVCSCGTGQGTGQDRDRRTTKQVTDASTTLGYSCMLPALLCAAWTDRGQCWRYRHDTGQ